ncbi:hypothetical protein ACH35V_32615 [Actinomadura sp. 1N219]|uniref:hypothetical protein n=1 Tax=Actinomadura sp. 1N219 TaxID=3375152 RepID=UPI0037B6D377
MALGTVAQAAQRYQLVVVLTDGNPTAERIVIQSYQDIIRWLGDADPTSRRIMESILAEEEDHAAKAGICRRTRTGPGQAPRRARTWRVAAGWSWTAASGRSTRPA